jgi:beta-aspartyl-peptidase (threonine type)
MTLMALYQGVIVAAIAWAGSGSAPDDNEPIHAILREQVACWNREDLDGFLDTYWRSPQLVFQSAGQRFQGWDALRQRFRKTYQDDGRTMGRLVFGDIEVERLAPDAALARGRWQLTMPDGKTPGGLFTLILRRRPEGWRIVHDHTSSDAP